MCAFALVMVLTTKASSLQVVFHEAHEASFRCLKYLACAYLCVGHSHDHLGAIFGDAARLILLPHHEAIDVLQENQGHSPLRAKLDEVGSCSRNRSSGVALPPCCWSYFQDVIISTL